MFIENKTEVSESCADCIAISVSLAAQQPILERHVLIEKKVPFSGGWKEGRLMSEVQISTINQWACF